MDVLESLKGRLAYDGAAVMVSYDVLKATIIEIEKLRDDAVQDGIYMAQLSDEVGRRAVGLCVDTKCGGCEGCKRRAAENELERVRGWCLASQEALTEILKELRILRREVKRLDV